MHKGDRLEGRLTQTMVFQPARAERGLDFDFGLMIGLQDNLFSTVSSCPRLHEAISGPFLSRRCAARLERTSGCEVVDRRAGLAVASFAVAHAIKDQLKFADRRVRRIHLVASGKISDPARRRLLEKR